MSLKITSERVRKWKNGAAGFEQWIKDIQPRILSPKGGFQVFEFADFQREAIRRALQVDQAGNWQFGTIGFSFPRRHSKTTLNALLVLWRFTLWQTENIKVMANTERQSLSVGFNTLKSIILNTPSLVAQIGRENVRSYEIRYPKLQNLIEAVSLNISSLYGERITVGWVSEIHAAPSEEPMQVLASSLGDSLNSWLLVDSTVDAVGGPLHRMEQLQESGEDPTVFIHRIEYKDLAEALEKSPPWIRRDWLNSRAKQLLPAVFATQHLNQRAAAANNLFAIPDIRACQEDDVPNPIPAASLDSMFQGRKYVCGGGLDRAFFGSIHGDKTIWTTVAKVADPESKEPEYWILNQQNILGSLGRGIKKAIREDMDRFKLKNISLESYNSQDIFTWCLEQGYPAEVISPTSTTQANAFPELYRLVKEHRLRFSYELKGLADEMETFVYELKNGIPKFGCDKWHDDRIYSLCWAVYALRNKELATYELKDIHCKSRSPNAHLCYLRQGDLILPCSNECPAHYHVLKMYNQYKESNVESEATLPEFFKGLVKVAGVKSYKMV
jgi:hypothetical protein